MPNKESMTHHFKNKLTFLFCLFIGLLTGFTACGLFGGGTPDNLLTVTPVSAVEAMLEIHADKGDKITIRRDDTEIFSFRMNRSDTLVSDTGLQPTTSYLWKASNGNGSKTRQATTLDTTSSNFTWQTFSFGEHSSGVLYGVSIIDENNIWAVGEIYMNDSTGQADSNMYNAVHWNGSDWELKRIRYKNFTPVINTVLSFEENDIWFDPWIHWDGREFQQIPIPDVLTGFSKNKMWGTSNNNIYTAGNNGNLIHYNGQTWQKIETDTDLDFYDIYGNPEQGVVAVAAQQSKSSDKAILRIKEDHSTKSLPTAPIPFSISGIWFDESGITYVVGSRISVKPDIGSTVPWVILDKDSVGHSYLFAVDANSLSDIVAAGGFGKIVHFNGAVWTLHEQDIAGNLYDIDVQENTIAAVGYDGRKAFITIGTRE